MGNFLVQYNRGMLLFVAMIFLKTSPGAAQQLIFRNIGDQLNLPSYECYNVTQDSKGYIWISTENGLCRYNGNALKVFSRQNGLPDNGIYFIKADSGFRLISSSSIIGKFSGNVFTAEKYATAFQKEMSKEGQRAYLINETPDGDIINTFQSTFLANRNSGTFINLTQPQSYKGIDLNVFVKAKGSYFIRNREISYPQMENGKYFLKIRAVSGKLQKEITIPFDGYTGIDRRIKLIESNGTLFLNLHDKLVTIDQSLVTHIYDMPSIILNLYADRKNGLWVGLFQKGLYYYSNTKRMDGAKVSLADYSVSGTLMDAEGGVWCSTLEKSVFYCYSVDALSYANVPQLNKVATLLKTAGGKLFVSTAHDNLFTIEGHKPTQLPIDKNQATDYTDIIPYKGKWYIGNKIYAIVANQAFEKETMIARQSYALDIFGDKLYSVNITALYEISNNKAYLTADIDAQGIRTLACLRRDAFYVGENTGLWKINPITKQQQKDAGIHSAVPKILKASDGRLWIATKGEGLQVMEGEKLRRIRFRQKHDLFFDLAEDRSGRIWASSENGLVSVESNNNGENITEYNTTNGLLSNDMGRVAIYGKELFVSTIDGLCSIAIDGLINNVPPKIYLDSFSVNKTPIRPGQQRIFRYDQNSVSLTFDVLTYKREQHDILLYRFEGQDSLWTGASENELHFNNLAPDHYKLAVYAINNDGIKSAPIYVEFTIEKPFWQQFWFVLLCLLLTAAALYFSIKKIITNVRAKEREKTRINTLISQSQLSALQAQMNPHFIFNAISSIQNYILKNNEREAYAYLAKFGKLIRMVLNNSRENTLPLFQELETLQLYVQLEQLRFKNSFEFVLNVHEEVDVYNTHLPTMLIQPYIENAIWHGLMNLKETQKGILQLVISLESGLLKIVVEDNGVGRECSNDYKKDTLHHSVGMKLTEQRLQTIYKLKEYEGISVRITDLKDASGKALGTRVELLLPLTL